MGGIIDCEMHIGDEVFVHGYIDEIRNDTIIIRNVGGYFGTSRDEVFYYEDDEYGTLNSEDRKTEPTISKMEQVEDEPQTERYCTNCKHNGVVADYECRECHGMDKHEFIEPQTDWFCDLCRREGDDICVDCERKKQSGKE